jgi:TRAP-type C4-dicarboxylate transport system permease small subunit
VTPAGGALAAVSRVMSRAGGVVLLTCAVLVGVEILSRRLLGVSPNMATELSSYGLAIASSFAFADTLLHRAHIRVDVAFRWFPPFVRSLLDLASSTSLALFGCLLAWRAAEVALESLRLGARENTALATPLVWPQGLWTLGLAWFALVALIITLRTAHALARRDLDTVSRLSGPAGIEDELEDAVGDAEARLSGAAGPGPR